MLQALFLFLSFLLAAYVANVAFLWRRDFRWRVTRRHPSSPSNPETRPLSRSSTPLVSDHVRLSFFEFLWASSFVGLIARCQWAVRLARLALRLHLGRRWGRWPATPDYDSLCAQLVLGCSLASCVTRLERVEKNGADLVIAVFHVPEFVHIVNDGEGVRLITSELTIRVRLNHDPVEGPRPDGHALLDCRLGERFLSAENAFLLLNAHLFFHIHVNIHAASNHAITVDEADEFLARMNVCTILFNYYGYTGFLKQLENFDRMKIFPLPKGSLEAVRAWITTVGAPLLDVCPQLVPYSSYHAFVLRVKSVFLRRFPDFRSTFVGVDAEALFLGTAMHCLDHHMAGEIYKDPLIFKLPEERIGGGSGCGGSSGDSGADEFRLLRRLCRFARAAFIDELNGFPFRFKFRDAPIRFFREVYEEARKENPGWADALDCCIIR